MVQTPLKISYMKKKTQKKIITFAVLLLVLGALIAGYVIQKNLNAVEEESEEDTSVTVFDKGTSIVTDISFESKKNSMAFEYINDDWFYKKDHNFPLDQDRTAAMADAVGKIVATVTIEDADAKLKDYGLEPADLTVKAVYSDGSERTFLFGDVNGFNGCQYFSISGDDKVYMVEAAVAEPFAADLDYLYEEESYQLQKNAVTDEDVSEITVKSGKKSKTITDAEGIAKLFELVYTLDLSEYEDYYADEKEMKDTYGISKNGNSIKISYTYESKDENGKATTLPKEYTIYIGHEFESAEKEDSKDGDTTAAEKDEKKTGVFYSFEGSTVVYSADKETVDDIFEFLTYKPAETTAAE